MPFALLIIGSVLLVSAVRDTQATLFDLVRKDFTGPNNFIYWTISILLIGAIGYIPKLKPLSVSFLVLVVLVLILTKGNPDLAKNPSGGFFQQFTRQLHGVTGTGNTQPVGPQISMLDLPSLIIGPGVPVQ